MFLVLEPTEAPVRFVEGVLQWFHFYQVTIFA